MPSDIADGESGDAVSSVGSVAEVEPVARVPTVSVIIPAHDRLEPLRACLVSVAEQTFRPIEVLVVDDASELDISSVVVSIEWPTGIEARSIRSEQNVGPGSARELGRRQATGDYLCFLDSDDLWAPTKVARQVERLEATPRAAMCYTATVEFSGLPLIGDEPIRSRSEDHFDSFLPVILRGRPWSTSSCMWRRTATDRIGPWLPAWDWEDYEYECRAGCLRMSLVQVPARLTFYCGSAETGRISTTDTRANERRRVPSLTAMARTLHASGEWREESGSRMEWLLLSNSLPLLDVGDSASARPLLQALARFSSSRRRRSAAQLITAVDRVAGPAIAVRVARRLRHHLFVA